jgi:hypothetical protein
MIPPHAAIGCTTAHEDHLGLAGLGSERSMENAADAADAAAALGKGSGTTSRFEGEHGCNKMMGVYQSFESCGYLWLITVLGMIEPKIQCYYLMW